MSNGHAAQEPSNSKPTKVLTIAEAEDIWLEDDSPVISFSACKICEAEGYPRQRGHSTTSCLADKVSQQEAIDE